MTVAKKKVAKKKAIPRRARAEEVVHEQHAGRQQDTWDEDSIHQTFEDVAVQEGPLPEIPARNGFDQRWIRTKLGGEDDPVNISKAETVGWKRRDPSTLPHNFASMRSYVDGIGDVVGISGLVLMERPKALSEVYRKKVRDRTNTQMRSVDESLYKTHSAGSGFGAPTRVEDTSKVTTGRPAPVADD